MPPTNAPGDSGRRPPGRVPLLLAGFLLCNLALAGWLLFSQARFNQRLDKLEADHAAAGAHPSRGVSMGERPTTAGRPERIALLLAAATDPEAARRLLESMPPGERVEIARALIARPAGNDRNAALSASLQKIAADDPAQALDLLDTLAETGLKGSLAADITATWIDHDPAAAAAWLATGDQPSALPRAALHRSLDGALTRWAEFDPAAATRFVAVRLPEDDADKLLLRKMTREWARKDASAALAWTQTLAEGDLRRTAATYGLLDGWAEVNPAQAAGYVGQLSYEPSLGYAQAVAARWADSNPTAAAQWAGSLSDPTRRHDAMWQVAQHWVLSDAPDAARWVGALPPGPSRFELWRIISDHWADSDPTATENWLGTLPANSGDRDAAVIAYAAKVVRTDPQKALTWAKTLSSGVYATQQTQVLLAAWARQDAPAARNWAAANQIALPSDR